jgi:hypothetical protein
MSDDNFKVPWHADENGLCHDDCESHMGGIHQQPCRIVAELPWLAYKKSIRSGAACPLAVLSKAFCLHERHLRRTT